MDMASEPAIGGISTSLYRLIDDAASRAEGSNELAPEVVDALWEEGVFRMMAPKDVGGSEASVDEIIDTITAISHADGSAGWIAGTLGTAGAVCGALLGDRAIDAIFYGNGRGLAAGQAAPGGKCEKVGDSYRVSGRFSFASGAPAADWCLGGFMLHEDGELVKGEGGAPVMLVGFVPREKVNFLGNWDVMGLRGTASYDYEITEQLIHEDFTFNPATASPKRGGALQHMGFMALPTISHGSFGVGVTRRILDEWRDYATKRKLPTGGTVSGSPAFQRDFARAEGKARAADAYLRRTFDQLQTAASAGTPDDDLRADGRLCANHSLSTGVEVAQTAFSACTTHALRNGNPIQRCFRDLEAGNAHFLTGQQSYTEAGAALAKEPGAQITF